MSCTVLNTLHEYFIYSSQQLCEVHTVFITILNLWKVKHREVNFSFKVMEAIAWRPGYKMGLQNGALLSHPSIEVHVDPTSFFFLVA